MGISRLFKTPLFWLAIVLMVCSGASELSMSQWASAYAESADWYGSRMYFSDWIADRTADSEETSEIHLKC